MEEPPIIEPPSRLDRLKQWCVSPEAKLYCSYFLSSWGDRMWSFALSIALGVIGGDLQYTAASGLVNSSTVLLFASLVGKWVDRTPRLNAARTALIVNNFSVASSASILVAVLFFPHTISPIWNGGLSILMISTSIILCAVSMLANCATKICITKDWVVVIAGPDKERLADINAMMVRIDMTSMVLSPMLAGQIMASGGTGWGCAFIGCWNVGSFLIEYFMQMAVYKSCPALAAKNHSNSECEMKEAQDESHMDSDHAEGSALTESTAPSTNETSQTTPIGHEPPVEIANESGRCCAAVNNAASSMVDSYKIYFRQSVLPAGFALASLYLTVLGFDGTTTVYILSLGLAENWIAMCNGLGAIMGFLGSFAYPRLRRKVGIHRTGLIASTMQWSCLILPVISIWLPGSNFDPSLIFGDHAVQSNGTNSTGTEMRMSSPLEEHEIIFGDELNVKSNATDTASGFLYVSKCSALAFIAGIVLSRMGLWMTDLAISQIFQESVAEHERGVVNGVQNSLNSIMDIVKGILVIILPDPRTFGILIVISWLAVFAGYLFYCYYSRSQRGHLLPFHKQFEACIAKDGTISTRERTVEPTETNGGGPKLNQ